MARPVSRGVRDPHRGHRRHGARRAPQTDDEADVGRPGGEGPDAGEQRDAEHRGAEGAQAGGAHDLEPPGRFGVGEKPVGGVGEAVDVKQAGDRQVGGDDEHCGEQGGEGPVGEPPHAADQPADQGTHGREPGQGA